MNFIKRINTKKIIIKNLQLGNQNKILIQSMCNIKTSNIKEVLKQIQELYIAGCDLIRLSVLDKEDANALEYICKHSNLPVIADIHFDPELAILAIKNGVSKIRLNPGNISDKNKLKIICDLCNQKNIPIRIGVNSGSLPMNIVNKYGISKEAMIETAKDYVKMLNDLNFNNIVISLKSSDPLLTINSYLLAASIFEYPLHVGVTEAGMDEDGIIKSTVGIAPILLQGIGDTIRVSLTNDPIKEIYVAKKILNTLKLREDMVDIISCPTCGRLEYEMFDLVRKIKEYTKNINKKITISILGCVVNGIGEGKHSDIGLAGSKDKCILFENGNILKTIDPKYAYKELCVLIDKYK